MTSRSSASTSNCSDSILGNKLQAFKERIFSSLWGLSNLKKKKKRKKKTFHQENWIFSATKHSSWVINVLHLVVCCVGWVHSFWVHFLGEFPGCWNVVLARKVYICIVIVPGRLCSGDNRTAANASHCCSPGYSSLKSHSYIGWIFFVANDHPRDGVLFLRDVIKLLQLTKVKVCRGRGTACTCTLTEDFRPI